MIGTCSIGVMSWVRYCSYVQEVPECEVNDRAMFVAIACPSRSPITPDTPRIYPKPA